MSFFQKINFVIHGFFPFDCLATCNHVIIAFRFLLFCDYNISVLSLSGILFLSLKRRYYSYWFLFSGSSDSSSKFICSLFSDWTTVFDSFILVMSSFWCSKIMIWIESDSHSSFKLNSKCWSVNLTSLYILICPLSESQIQNPFVFSSYPTKTSFSALTSHFRLFWCSKCLFLGHSLMDVTDEMREMFLR